MKLTVIALTLLILFSCGETTIQEYYPGYKEQEFDIAALKDSGKQAEKLAHIKIKIPQQLDTFYQWHRLSDCASCGKMEYRFADKRYSQFAESGFIWTNYPDSVFQLTFIHDPIVTKRSQTLNPVNKADSVSLANYIANQSTWCDQYNFLYRKYIEVNDRSFILCAFTTNCSIITHNQPTLLLGAITSLKNTSLLILAETNAKDGFEFESKMKKALSSIVITE